MPEVNDEWVRKQLEEAKVKIGSGKAVLKLLETWAEIPSLSPNLAKEAIEVFSKLALNKPAKEEEIQADEVWTPLQPGNITVGDVVRVMSDAFEGNSALIHNGRRGKVIAVRYGDVIVNSTDGKTPELKGVHYSPYKLEKKVK
jgi:hypothetical protein